MKICWNQINHQISIFRQDGGDVGSFIQTAMTVFSVVSSLFGSGGGSGAGGALDVIGSLLGGGGGSSSSSQSANQKGICSILLMYLRISWEKHLNIPISIIIIKYFSLYSG